MKVTVDIDCTPEEARRFMGLPDISAVHEAYVEKMVKAVSEGVSADQFTEMMKNWGPLSETALSMWQSMFNQMSGKK